MFCCAFEGLPHDYVGTVALGCPISRSETVLAEVHHELLGCGRLVVRYSGTEPVLRVMIESDDAAKNERFMEEILSTIREHLF